MAAKRTPVMLYVQGPGVAQGELVAARRYLRAATCAEARAHGHPGELSLQGQGVPADELEVFTLA